MGKIRIKTLGDEELEQEQKKEAQKRKEGKKVVKGAHGGERVVAVGPTEEELEKVQISATEEMPQNKEKEDKKEQKKTSKYKEKKGLKSTRSKRYKEAKSKVENRLYSLQEALKLLQDIKLSQFDETVELHINTIEPGLTGSFTLPHGSGKKVRVAIADDAIIQEVSTGKINFDVLLAEPSIMPKLAKVAKILGPKGLMPNPKNGTVTNKPQEEVKKYQGGHTSFKTESKLPVIHLSVGKLSFGEEKLSENIKTALQAVQSGKIKSVTLKSTMSPGIKLEL